MRPLETAAADPPSAATVPAALALALVHACGSDTSNADAAAQDVVARDSATAASWSRLASAVYGLAPRVSALVASGGANGDADAATPIEVVVAVPSASYGDGERDASSSAAASRAHAEALAMRLLTALAVGGGHRRLVVRLVEGHTGAAAEAAVGAAGGGGGGDGGGAVASSDAAWRAWACAVGIEARVERVAYSTVAAHPAHVAILPASDAADLAARGRSWDLVHSGVVDDGFVVGLQGAAAHTMLSTREQALALHLTDDVEAMLAGVGCSTCEVAAAEWLRAGCDLRRYRASASLAQLSERADAVLDVLLETAAGWPTGYRLTDRCSGIADFLGAANGGGGGGLRAMCVAHGCA